MGQESRPRRLWDHLNKARHIVPTNLFIFTASAKIMQRLNLGPTELRSMQKNSKLDLHYILQRYTMYLTLASFFSNSQVLPVANAKHK